MARPKNKHSGNGHLRIIGGQWRGRKLAFTPAPGLRPTPDRVRETLFNWLAPEIRGARCADLFAGSGALGLEALSRGAGHCAFVDTSRPALAQISRHLTTLDATSRAVCHLQSAEHFIGSPRELLDVVFIDPPFGRQLVRPLCHTLEEVGALAPGAWIYIEMGSKEGAPEVPDSWRAHRDKVSGEVAYRLYQRA